MIWLLCLSLNIPDLTISCETLWVCTLQHAEIKADIFLLT